MEPIFDRAGKTVGWRKRDVIYGLDGRARALVSQRAVFALDGSFLARFEDDLYRDPQGRVVAFEREATGGPLLPVPGPLPVAAPPEVRPPQPQFAPVPASTMRSMRWSDLSWDEVLAGAAVSPTG